jgi:hypothetical protein
MKQETRTKQFKEQQRRAKQREKREKRLERQRAKLNLVVDRRLD